MYEFYSLRDKIIKQNEVQANFPSKCNKFHYEVMKYKKYIFQFLSCRNKAQLKMKIF